MQVGCVCRLMPSIFLIETGDNCLRPRSFQTIGKMALLPPSRCNLRGSLGPFPCSARLCDHRLAWGRGTPSALSPIPKGPRSLTFGENSAMPHEDFAHWAIQKHFEYPREERRDSQHTHWHLCQSLLFCE